MHEHEPRTVLCTLRRLPPAFQPIYIFRTEDVTLTAVDPRCGMLEVTMACVDQLTVEEQNLYRAAFGYGPVGTVLDEPALTDPDVHLSWTYMPDSLLTTRGQRTKARIQARLAAMSELA